MADLTTTAAVKAFMGITGTELDALLGALVTRASAQVETYLSRSVLVSARTESRDGTGGQAMVVRDLPLRSVQSVVIDGRTIPAQPSYGQAGYWFDDEVISLVGYTFTRGRRNVQLAYTAGFDAVPADIEQTVIETVALACKRKDHIDVSSKSLAGETISYLVGALTPSAKQVLDQYRRVVPL